MFDPKKEITEDNSFFNNLFENTEKEQDEELYKKNLYVLKEELDSRKDENSIKFMHDVLLSKLILEDYTEFPPKIENNNSSVNNDNKKEEDPEKLFEEENDFLREMHKINYLTFSPFALNFFEKSINPNNENIEIIEQEEEKEKKILKMINFNYDNYELNNDLLFNICQGFIDINKLKEENLSLNQQNLENNKSTMPTETLTIETIRDKELVEEEEELDKKNIDFVMNCFKHQKNSINYKEMSNEFMKEMKNLPNNIKNKEKNIFFLKWKNKIIEKEKLLNVEREKRKIENERLMIELKQKEIEKKKKKKKDIKI